MSKFKVGDIVKKRQYSGFITREGIYKISDDHFSPWCLEDCGDEDCVEWNTLWEVDENGKETGAIACHVSECCMEEIK